MKWPLMLRRTHDAAVDAWERERKYLLDCAAFNRMYWDDYKAKYEALKPEKSKQEEWPDWVKAILELPLERQAKLFSELLASGAMTLTYCPAPSNAPPPGAISNPVPK